MESIMQYINRHGHKVTVRKENIKTQKWGEHTLAYVSVIISSPAGTYHSTCSVAGRSSRIARVALKQELKRAMLAKDTPTIN